jgi:hypothetical protein
MEQHLLDAVTATTTSGAFSVEPFARIGLQLTASGITSGNGAFTVEATIDGTNWVALNTIIDNVTNTNAQDYTRLASKTLSADGSALVWLLDLPCKAIRVKVTRTTDGAYSAHVIAS